MEPGRCSGGRSRMTAASSHPAVSAPFVSAVVLHYRRWPGVASTLNALLAQSRPPDEIIVVDNFSNDGSLSNIRKAYPHVRIIANGVNGGYAGGMNAGIAATDPAAAMILLVTHECVIHAQSLDLLVQELGRRPDAGCVGPKLYYLDQPDRLFSCGQYARPLRKLPRHRSVEPDEAGRGSIEADALDGACLLLRRKAIESVGLMDEEYFLYFEETDYCYRLRRAGWSVLCVLSARALQDHGRIPVALFARNRLRFLKRNAGVLASMLDAVFQTGAALSLLLESDAASKEKGREVLRGLAGWYTRRSAHELLPR